MRYETALSLMLQCEGKHAMMLSGLKRLSMEAWESDYLTILLD